MELQLEELEAAATEDELAAEQVAAGSQSVQSFQRKRPSRKPFPDHLPRERVVTASAIRGSANATRNGPGASNLKPTLRRICAAPCRIAASPNDLFRARLDQIINLKHELVQLAGKVDWDWIDGEIAPLYSDNGRPGTLGRATQIRSQQQRQRGWKLYSFHAPEVECIGKGKAAAPYEFGVKASIVTNNRPAPGGQFVLHAEALPDNPYDGHTLRDGAGLCRQRISRP